MLEMLMTLTILFVS